MSAAAVVSPLWAFDQALRAQLPAGRLLAGVDEAGRGPLAGPVVAGAAVLDPQRPIAGLNDSKQLTARKRGVLDAAIREQALAFGIGVVEADEIDRLGILKATFLAMARAVEALGPRDLQLLVDGRDYPFDTRPGRALVKGDGTSACIAAASILAKEHRDRRMVEAAGLWPGYGFEGHKGYGSALHLEALARLGPCPIHRRSFRPLADTGQGLLNLES